MCQNILIFFYEEVRFFSLALPSCCSPFYIRCANKTQEDDYRPILENFITDILTTLNMPEWPSAEISSLPVYFMYLYYFDS